MIGPHEGQELVLMLAGEKSLAMFHDALPDNDVIPEEIIPERAFAPHVQQGRIKRFAEDIRNAKNGRTMRFVCFTLPGHEWRAHCVLWLKREFFTGRLDHHPEHEALIGRLLGYNEADIAAFLS